MREKVLNQLHKEHQGIVKCKLLAKATVWWPGITAEIESFINSCSTCQSCNVKKRQCSLSSWKESTSPLERIHADHFNFKRSDYLIVVDDCSGWIHVDIQKKINSENVIVSLKNFFSVFGLAETLVTDNGPAFVSSLFERFCKSNNIKHVTSPPDHPQSNGLAERAVGIVKSNLRKYLIDSEKKTLTIESQIQNFLFMSHSTPTTDGKSPAEKIFNYKIRTNISALQMQQQNSMKSYQNQSNSMIKSTSQKNGPRENKNNTTVKTNFDLKDEQPVYAKFGPDGKVVEATIKSRISAYIYWVCLPNGRTVKIHRDSLRIRSPKWNLNFKIYKSNKRRSRVFLGHDCFSPKQLRKKKRVDYRKFF